MTITERLFAIAKEKNIKQADLANALDIKAQIVNNWKTRGTTPPMEYLPTICEVLDISWEFLVTGSDPAQAPRLTVDEEHLLRHYRGTDTQGRARILEYARDMTTLRPAYDRESETDAKIG